MISQSSCIMGWLGSKSRSLGQILEKSYLYSRVTFLVQSSSNLFRMFVLVISHCRSIMGWVGSECRSLGQILENIVYTRVYTRDHISSPIFTKLDQNVSIMISRSSSIMDGAGSKVGHKVKSSLSLRWAIWGHPGLLFELWPLIDLQILDKAY